MDLAASIAALETQAASIAALARAFSEAESRLRPAPGSWSALEVLCHLYDEEREDFRARLDYTLHRPGEQVPSIDPEGWVTARDYASRDPRDSLAAFLDERARSLEWLRGLRDPDWERPVNHPALAEYGVRAGDLLASWVAHDLLHLRQLIELRYSSLEASSAPYRLRYAGEW
jgi:hypothetical protein